MAQPSPIRRPSWPKSHIALAAATAVLACSTAQAQNAALKPVVVTGRSAPAADVTGFGDAPLTEVPVSATIVDHRQIEATGARRLADLAQFDSSVSDAYNAPGYWDFISVRGFTLDNRFNYRREGLPINAETTIALDNKERVEILKGTSGIQAGTSAPGGLVNYVVKRPTEQDLREVRLEWTSRASVLAAVDLGGRAGKDGAFGYRLNVAQERLRPLVRDLDGNRSLVSLATDWRLGRDSVLSAEFEWSRKTQASQVGYSLLGSVLPSVPDPRLNLNNQPWVQPSRFEAATGSVRFDQGLGDGWRWSASLGTQRLKNDDYTAFPFGCGAEGNYDRYCSDGSFDYYDFRSENERRRQDAGLLNLKGKLSMGAVTHDLSFGVLAGRVRNRVQPQAYNYVGTGYVDGTAVAPPDPTLTYEGTNRDERSLEFSAQDAIRWNERFTTWLGMRHTRLHRDSVMTDGSAANSYAQQLTTPWIAASLKLTEAMMGYASWGQGVESQQVPNNAAIYANPGQVLPALKSRQVEVGVKGEREGLGWQLVLFRIHRPMSNIDYCNRTYASCVGQSDGEAVHQGVEANLNWARGPWSAGGGVTLLNAKRRGSALEPAGNGKRPVNVPDAVVRAHVAWRMASAPGLELRGTVSHEGRRSVLADESVVLPGWTRLDAALRYETKMGATATTWSIGVDNLTNKRFWKESPTQFGHVYLYPGAPRTFRVSFTAAL
ncbi:TonB-dependent siderophore receptor [Caenimonas aquaedulcis]|uniref:TonB-dependent siderophore receptor n=1 Tax=Caenimonas aquaedulcis TaxID=2793270 RepID=A0A931MF88_9BURK|nr:TonB-dependent siderophore receptor [Caenimonas aquaedulcis]MBG9387122.1 TonB-dependent siderophore receptor [Caenimonas aquaedulcis]